MFRGRYPLPLLPEGQYRLLVTARDAVGNAAAPYQVRFRVSNERRLTDLTAYPNPFREQTIIAFHLTGEQPPAVLTLTITDLTGRVVRHLKAGQAGLTGRVGRNEWSWDGRADSGEPLPAGVYLYKFTVGDAGTPWPVTDEANARLRGRLILAR